MDFLNFVQFRLIIISQNQLSDSLSRTNVEILMKLNVMHPVIDSVNPVNLSGMDDRRVQLPIRYNCLTNGMLMILCAKFH